MEIRDISPLICELRGQAVMLDRDLAELYHVMTGRLNEAVKRNIARFPPEFMFQLTDEEMKELIANCDRFKMMKHSPSRMYAFTEQGVAMLSAVLKMRTHSNGELAESDFEAFAAQCGKFAKTICGICHDRFIVVDQKEIYWTGASLKDAGRLTFAAAKMGAEVIPGLLDSIRKATTERRDYSTGKKVVRAKKWNATDGRAHYKATFVAWRFGGSEFWRGC